MNIDISQFTIESYDDVLTLWQQCEGVGLSDADSRENIQAYLERNPGMSFVSTEGGIDFWKSVGWNCRPDICVMSKVIDFGPDEDC